jgi:rhamnosyltransferase
MPTPPEATRPTRGRPPADPPDTPPLPGPRVAVVVVLYRPDEAMLARALACWREEVDELICVDNSGGAEASRRAAALATLQVRIAPMPANVGLGAAHNRGIAIARELGCSHVVLGDQDSRPRPGMVRELLRVEAEALGRGLRVAAVGPRCIESDEGGRVAGFVRCAPLSFRGVPCDDETGWVVADFLISSGSLIRMAALDAVGPMDEGLFIDLVDTEWFLRARHAGLMAIGACGAWMVHRLGEETLAIRLGRTRTVPVHKPFRYYYMFRNSLLLYRRRYVRRTWIVPDVVKLGQLALFFGVIHPARRQNARMMLAGVLDGLRGVTGPRRTDADADADADGAVRP